MGVAAGQTLAKAIARRIQLSEFEVVILARKQREFVRLVLAGIVLPTVCHDKVQWAIPQMGCCDVGLNHSHDMGVCVFEHEPLSPVALRVGQYSRQHATSDVGRTARSFEALRQAFMGKLERRDVFQLRLGPNLFGTHWLKLFKFISGL